ncbi:MAG: tRNA pseudouridine(55) synthase TruB [Fidelibacterota bacterium]
MILNINKPADWTSFDVVKKIRNITRRKKVGHGGTLDPFATGVLVVATDSDTKKLGMISSERKSYKGRIKLGAETDTLDPEGTVIKTRDIPDLTPDEVNEVFARYQGNIEQIPPMYSAKKVGGKKLYEYARKNIEIERKPSSITIYALELLALNLPYIDFSVSCSKGTYIRVLARDIAADLHTCGYLVSLVRTQVGPYTLETAVTMKDFTEQWLSTKN